MLFFLLEIEKGEVFVKTRKDTVLEYLQKNIYDELDNYQTFTTSEISKTLNMQRTYVSTLLNELVDEKKIEKIEGRPVKYKIRGTSEFNENSYFSNLVGYNKTIEFEVEKAKSVFAYPLNQTDVLITGEIGTGKTTLAKQMYDFGIKKGLLNGILLILDCVELIDIFRKKDLFESNLQSKINGSIVGLIIINNIELINNSEIKSFLNTIHEITDCQKCLGIVNSTEIKTGINVAYEKQFNFHIGLPNLKEYTIDERMDCIKKFVNEQSRILNRKIAIDPMLLRCLLYYNPLYHFETVKKDIAVGCMNAYYNQGRMSSNEIMYLFIKEFPKKVREGLSLYKEQRKSLNNMIDNVSYYIFDGQNVYTKNVSFKNIPSNSIISILEQLVSDLKEQGATEDEIQNFLSTDFLFYYQMYTEQISSSVRSDGELQKLVDDKVSEAVFHFLKKAEETLNRVYKKENYYGLCIFMNEIVHQKRNLHPAIQVNLPILRNLSLKEYELAERFRKELQNEFNVDISESALALMTLVLLDVSARKSKLREKPIIMVVMHGKGVASSISKTVKELAQSDNIYPFEILLDKPVQQSAKELRDFIIEQDNSQGILMFYDMGSIKELGLSISQETGLSVKLIQLPLTLVVLDALKKAEITQTVAELYTSTLNSYSKYYSLLNKSYVRLQATYSILTLCEEGHEEAVQIKRYLEENMDLKDIEVIAIDTDNQEFLVTEINRIRKKTQIICVVGTYNPHLFNIPYLSLAKFISIPKNMLDYLLLFTDLPMKEKEKSYKQLAQFLKKNKSKGLNSIEIDLLKKIIQQSLKSLVKFIKGSALEKELIIFLYISLIGKKERKPAKMASNQKKVIRNNKVLYNHLIELSKTIENELGIRVTDWDLANLINLIRND